MGWIGQTNFYLTEVSAITTSMWFLLHNLKHGKQRKEIEKWEKEMVRDCLHLNFELLTVYVFFILSISFF